jgi:hypothetical protein
LAATLCCANVPIRFCWCLKACCMFVLCKVRCCVTYLKFSIF